MAAMGVRVVEGDARFISPKALDVAGTTLTARRFVLATGSRPALPAIDGLTTVPHLTTETVLRLNALPRHLAIAGGGATSIALAQAFRRFGADVTVFEPATILSDQDPDMVRALRAKLVAEGITIHERTELIGVAAQPDGISITARRGGEQGTAQASHLLVATGRRANIDTLNLSAAGIVAAERQVGVDTGLRTANRKIYALGETADPRGLDEISAWHGTLVAQNCLLRKPVRTEAVTAASQVLTDPGIASAGLSEAAARRIDPTCRVLLWPLSENEAALAKGRSEGFIKLIVSGKGRVLGCSILASDAGDLIAPFVLALAKGLHVSDLAAMILPHPSVSESGKRAAATYLQTGLSNPWIGRIIRLFRRFG